MTLADEHRKDLVRAVVQKGKAPVVWYETIFGGGRVRHQSVDGDMIDLSPEAAAPFIASGALVKV